MPKGFLSTPSARRATAVKHVDITYWEFLSTPSARRATHRSRRTHTTASNFYPRPPRGGRRADKARHCQAGTISIHALREEGDARLWLMQPSWTNFYPRPPRGGRLLILNNFNNVELFLSTPSARRATVIRAPLPPKLVISIHALREEGDGVCRPRMPSRLNFYPRPPRGGRRISMPIWTTKFNFYPRPPRGGRRGSLLATIRLD